MNTQNQTKQFLPLILLLTGTILFNYLFWNQLIGVNLLIFTVFITISYVLISGFAKKTLFIISGLSLLVLSVAITLHSSDFAFVMYLITFVLFVGTTQETNLKSTLYAVLAAFNALFEIPKTIINKIPIPKKNKLKLTLIFRFIKISVIPIIILLLFYVIFINANPVFDSFSSKFFKHIADFITPIFKEISFARIFFILFGFSIIAWVLFKTDLYKIVIKESKKEENIMRKRKKRRKIIINPENTYYKPNFSLSLGLKSEFISSLILLILVNILLFIVNIIDVKWVWFGFEYSKEFDLKQFVHEGTYLLIISILLSIIIMLYYFRRNLNFYPKNSIIQKLSYIWIAQNIILVVSVIIRNLHYITYFGLAYKRIGVFIFLIAVIYGLFTLYVKIKYKKSFYYLLRTNSLAVFIILVVSGLLNWDIIIAKHNLNHKLKDNMETSYLLSMSDKVLPLIDKHKYILEQYTKLNTYRQYSVSYEEYYNEKVDKFIKKYKKHSWLSWNYADWKAYEYFSN